MRATIIVFFIWMGVCCAQQSDQVYKNYCTAINNNGNFQHFVLIKVKNLNTGVIRNVCTQAIYLRGALHIEYKFSHDSSGESKAKQIALNAKDNYFEFKNDTAFNNVIRYTDEELSLIEKKVNFDSLAQLINNKREWKYYCSNFKEMYIYAHALFKRGIFTGEALCENAASGPLEYVDPTDLNRKCVQTMAIINYKTFKRNHCKKDLEKCNDSEEAKEAFCTASYTYYYKEYFSAIDYLRKAYMKSSSAKLKFQILKMLVDSYMHLGDKTEADKYQVYVDKILTQNPAIGK